MTRVLHGGLPTTEDAKVARAALADRSAGLALAFAAAEPVDLHDFDFMFPTLQDDPANQLPQVADMPAKLKALAVTMEDPGPPDPGDAEIPAGYTYFAQFVDHDITFEVQPADLPPSESGAMPQLLDPNMTPLALPVIRNVLRNFRTASLDLDNVYGLPAPRDAADGNKMRIGHVEPVDGQVPFAPVTGKGLDNDVPREPPNPDILHDRAALIGDPRNDENTIISQLQVAFLKAHNALVDQGRSFEEARRVLRQHYQHLVIHDLLKRVADAAIVDGILQNGNRWFNTLAEPFFMPLEFSVAAFRFGHTMVRPAYKFNSNFNFSGPPATPATLRLLFTFSALSGQLGPGEGADTLPANWVIQWENLVDDGTGQFGKSRRFDTNLAGLSGATGAARPSGLFALQNLQGDPETPVDAGRLAVRNLLRGYRLRIPTGQAVAQLLGVSVLTPEEIKAAASSPAQLQALQVGGFTTATPLWFYILSEAKVRADGQHLGPVGSTIVAEVLIGLVRKSEDSILRTPGWMPSLGSTPGQFDLPDLLRLAGVLDPAETPPKTYVVQPGETLTSIAEQELGDTSRWPEIFALNRATVQHPDRIFPGQVLILPGPTPLDPTPRFVVVQPGETLSGIAARELGQSSRWPEIFGLNRDVINDPDVIIPGQLLLLPPN